ncbi:MAG TPA: lactate utilization protein C [Deltaproteobacteria bacterium]|nr:lactate utilization protein C [Deltaproteobacteria bacterium]
MKRLFMNNPYQWHIERMVFRTIEALNKNYFQALYFNNRETLIREVTQYGKPKMKVGFGGSVTTRELGLATALKNKDVVILDHWKEGLTREDIEKIRVEHLICDLFISSANAITEKGEIVNIDGIGNRINSLTFGPKKIIIIAGYNKIVPDIPAALERIKRIAAPMNAKRLNLPLPCVETGYCVDCKSEARICRAISIMQRKPSASDISVFIINEILGY